MQLTARRALYQWYLNFQRPLPWRMTSDPFHIWLSETMLQQTTVAVVVPYFEKFLRLFPTIEHLARAPESQVLKAWSGLGYYSRARNLHRAAQLLSERGRFPRTYRELLELPGFGPYTARAVSSIAFGEPVGVLDGNVIRVLCRYHALSLEWWKPAQRQRLQEQADLVVQDFPPAVMNQALMDLGATICTASRPSCALCPLRHQCLSLKEGDPHLYPLKKPRRQKQFWVWEPEIWVQRGRIALVWNDGAVPFLKNHWLLPGLARQRPSKPKKFRFCHHITHHEIFVSPRCKTGRPAAKDWKWVPIKKIDEWVPASLIKKTLESTDKNGSPLI